MYQDLREFLDSVEKMGELRRVDGADPHLEMGAITEVAAGSPSCPSVLFDKIKGYPPGYRVVSNLLHTPARLALAIGLPTDLKGVAFVKEWKERMHLGRIPPMEVKARPAFTENVLSDGAVDIFKLPAPKWHEHDGGRYLGTGAITVMRDPESGYINFGVYRLQAFDRSTLGVMNNRFNNMYMIRQKYWDKGESCPVAVCFGVDPGVWLAGMYPVPLGMSEFDVAGWLRGKPIEVVRGELTGLPIPTNAEAVLEGEVPPLDVEGRVEGPFGEYTGYYASGARPEPILRVKRMMYRADPILHGAPPMKPVPGLYHFGIQWRAALIWTDLENMGIQGITGVWQHAAWIFISLKQMYAGHAQQAALIAAGSLSADFTRFIAVMDDDVDPSNMSEVLWAISTRCDPGEIDTAPGLHAGVLDPRLSPDDRERNNLTIPRAIINACRPFHWRDRFPLVNEISPELKAATLKKWGAILR